MKEQKKQPELRFKGFTDDWEQVELSELVTKEKSYSLSRDVESEKETENRYIHYGDIHTGIADKITNKNQLPFIKEDSYEPLLKGDLILADASEDYQGIATPAIILETTKYRIVAGLHTIVLRPSDKCDSLYLYYLLKTKSFKKHGYRMGTGMKVFGITANNVLAFKTLLPSKKEQNKISQLLKIMDRLLTTLQQRKLELLKKLKRGYLQQMFPVKNQYIPRLRFREFNGDWEQVKLKDMAESLDYGLNAEAREYDGKNKYIRITDINDVSREFIPNPITSPNIDNLELQSDYKLQLGDILFTRTGASVGKTYHYKSSDGNLYYAGFLIRARIKSSFSSMFLYQFTWGQQYKKFVDITSQRSGQPGINAKEYGNFSLLLSTYEEQKKIGDFFQRLDQAITLQQLKINQLQKLKQAYLQKLFP